jgi:hypothetical protein
MGGGQSYEAMREDLLTKIRSAEGTLYSRYGKLHGDYQSGRHKYQRQYQHETNVKLKPGYGKTIVVKSKRRPGPAGGGGGGAPWVDA